LGFHLINIFLHSLNCTLVTFLALFLTQNKLISLLAGILFCGNPAFISDVLTVGNRTILIEVLFVLLSLSSAVRYFLGQKKSYYFFSLISFMLAVLSREGGLLIPLYIVGCAWAIGLRPIRILKETLPFLAFLLFYLFLREYRIIPVASNTNFFLTSVVNYVRFIPFYLFKALTSIVGIFPGFPLPKFIALITKGLGFAVFLVLLFYAFRLSRLKDRLARLALVLIIVGILPVFFLSRNILYFGYLVLSSYLYLPTAAVMFILAILIVRFSAKFPKTALISTGLIFFFYTSQTIFISKYYKNIKELCHYLISLDEKNCFAHYNLGVVYAVFHKSVKRAEEEFKKVIQFCPRDSMAYEQLGYIYFKRQEFDKALEYYQKAISLDEYNINAYLKLADFYWKQGKLTEAKKVFQKAIKLYPDYLPTLKELSYFLIQNREYKEALPLGQKILKTNPEDSYALNSLGIIYAKEGDFSQAEIAFKMVLRLEPNNLLALLNLTRLYLNAKDYDKAKDFCSRALKLDSENKVAQELMQKIEKLAPKNYE